MANFEIEIVEFGPVRLRGVHAKNGAKGANKAFLLLREMGESIYPGGYGDIDSKTGETVFPGEYGLLDRRGRYYASLVLDWRNKDSELEELEIPRGKYACTTLYDWEGTPGIINQAFDELAEKAVHGSRQENKKAPRVEVYRSAGAVGLLIPLVEA